MQFIAEHYRAGSGLQVNKMLVGVPVWIWKCGAFSVACIATLLLEQIDWKTLGLDCQAVTTGMLAIVAALGTIMQTRASDRRNDKHHADFVLRPPTAQPRYRHHDENQPDTAHGSK